MINLLPHKIKESRKYGRRNRFMLGYSVLLMLTALSTAGVMAGSLQFIGSDKSKLIEEIKVAEQEILLLEKDVKETEKVAARLATANEIRELSVSFSDLIPKIGAVLPEGAILNSLSLSGGVTAPLQLNVSLSNSNLAPILIRNLVESDLFEAADISSLTPAPEVDAGQYGSSASITASFTGAAEIKNKAAATAKAKAAAASAAAAGDNQ